MRPHFRRFTGDLGVSNGGWKEARSTPIIGEVSTGRKVKQVGLSPEVPVNARVLVLGSFPGRESLRQRAYYAHPDNLFWAFMQELLGIPRTLPYRERLRRLNLIKAILIISKMFKSNNALIEQHIARSEE
ncbi:MAG TPA: hypothetical protein EYP62_07925, partial [Kiritimatiellae bacterium]|nr:hypothetical protein [Kiritimatiellia bacterium]